MATEVPSIPDGWTEEAFITWLQGDKPDDWTAEQWESMRQEHASILEATEIETD